jgi:hypothetical protein
LLAAVLVVVAIVAIAGLLYRPATVIGASEKSLAYSLRQEAGSDQAACAGSDDDFTCVVAGDAKDAPPRYDVTVDGYGCWEAKERAGGNGDGDLSGCITVKDLIRSDD